MYSNFDEGRKCLGYNEQHLTSSQKKKKDLLSKTEHEILRRLYRNLNLSLSNFNLFRPLKRHLGEIYLKRNNEKVTENRGTILLIKLCTVL